MTLLAPQRRRRFRDPSVLLRMHAGMPLPNEATFARSSLATYFGADGILREAGADVPRVDWSNGWPALLLEPQRTNLVPSPRLDTDSNGDGFPDGVVVSAHEDYTVTPLSMSDGTFTFRVERIADTGGWGGGIRIDIPGIVQGDVLSSGIDVLVTPGSTPLVGDTRYFWEYTDDATDTRVSIPAVQYPADGQWHRLLIENVTIEQVVRANTFRLIVRTGRSPDPIGGSATVSVRRPQIERGPTASSFAVGTRALDLLTADVTAQFAGRRSFALYQRFEERGTIVIRDWARALSLQSDAGTLRIWAPGSGAATYEAYVASGLYAKIPSSGTPALRQTVELLMVVAEDGTLTLAQSIDGGPVVAATGSHGGFVPTGTVTLAWGSTVSGSNHGALAGRDLLVLDGADWTMDAVRRLLP